MKRELTPEIISDLRGRIASVLAAAEEHGSCYPGAAQDTINALTLERDALIAEVRRLRAVVDLVRANVCCDRDGDMSDQMRDTLALLDATPPAAGDSGAK